MKQFLKKNLELINLTSALGLVVFAIFPFRKTLLTSHSFIVGHYSDFLSIVIPFALVPLLTPLIAKSLSEGGVFKNFKEFYKEHWYISLFLIYLYLNFALKTTDFLFFGLYKLFYLTMLWIALPSWVEIVKNSTTWWNISKTLIFMLFFQTFLGLLQVILQRDVGLMFLMEPRLSADLPGLAREPLLNFLVLRAYGTFLHPNIFAFFAVFSTLSSLFLLNGPLSKQLRYILWANCWLAVILSGSRGALLGLFSIFVISFTWKRVSRGGLILSFALLSAVILFSPLLSFRLHNLTDGDNLRLEQSKIALELMHQNPIFGIGLSESMLHMEHFFGNARDFWKVEPIHSFVLTILTELGFLGLILFLLIYIKLVRRMFRMEHISENEKKVWFQILSFGMLISLFDHYLITSFQAGILSFIVVAYFISRFEPTYDNRSF